MTTTLTFRDAPLELLEMDGKEWVRGPQLAGALGYNRDDRIADLYARNESEFTENMTRVVELPTAGGPQQVRVFTLRGAHLLGMLARTEFAAEFRHWVLDVLDGIVAPQQTGRMTHPQRLAHIRERRIIMKELGKCVNLGEAVELYHDLRDVTRMLGRHLSSTLDQLAPGVRQQALALEGGAS